MSRILIIDDEKSIRHSLKEILEYENYKVDEAPDGIEGIKMAEKEKYDIIFCDIKMPRMDGIEVLENLQNKCPEVPVVMISGHGNIDTAVEAIRKGAFDFIAKPLDLNRILITVRNALDRTVLVKETKTLKRKMSRTNEMIGDSEGIKKIKDMIERVAPTDARVMITGSNGTGKELVARWIHEKSERNNMPLIEVNCAAIPSELIESELFGHEKGAFTSAIKTRSGKFEQANGGTIFLDEIGDMSLSAQAKVLRALQENRITRKKKKKDFPVDVRIIAATNKDLRSEIEKNNFREDLYHRLSVILIHVPSLDDRREDIPVLVNYFLKEIADEYKSPVKTITPDAIEQLQQKNWTGNIRELRNVVERLVILGGKTISKDDVINYVGAK